MDFKTNLAAQAYGALKRVAPEQQKQNPLADKVADFAATLAKGEDTAKAVALGQSDMQSLVEALSQSQLAIETAVSVRDKVVEAYQEIMRMPI